MKLIAHVRPLENGEWDTPHWLVDHLQKSAELAAGFAADFNSRTWGYSIGLAHDAGKGTHEWQKYLQKKSGYDEEASSEAPGRIEHSGSSAQLAEEVFGKAIGRFHSYCIAGHHAGLPDYYGTQSSLAYRLENTTTEKIEEEVRSLLNGICPNAPPWKFSPSGLDISLWIRMLFSCLVDADRLNTEAYMNPEQGKEREGYSSIARLHERFNEAMAVETRKPQGVFDESVYEARQQVLADCREAAKMECGFFSLTVPTGGGKTLSSMAFALGHAARYNKKRVIYVIPYTSIIEQNARVFCDIFGSDEIVEHHSNLDDDEITQRSRLAAENWDAPIIVTTSVQFFESLFAAKPGRCRKLHNIANSVVILDEAQLVPSDFLEPILEAMRLLTEHYKVSFVICTATQPVFEKQKDYPDFPGLPEGSIREIIQDVPALYAKLERVKVELPEDLSVSIEWKDLAKELSAFDQVLCVVSDRKSCRELYALMPEGTFHLSALMCGQHRSDIIASIKHKLKQGESVHVISTQLIEAGVDVDFPVVYRALAGLDSIAQAAGRCNREGKLNTKGEFGRVVVFRAPRNAPAGMLRKASQTAEHMLKGNIDNPIDKSVFPMYFSELYWKAHSLDKKEIMRLLKPEFSDAGMQIQFRSAADEFKMIDDAQQKSILVPYDEGGKLLELVRKIGSFTAKLSRKMQRYTVNIYENEFNNLLRQCALEQITPGVFVLNNMLGYSRQIGLLIDEIPNNPKDFIQ